MTVIQQFVDGDDEKGWRVRLKTGGGNDTDSMDSYFVVKEEGEYRILGSNEGLADLGKEAFRRARAGNLAGARQLLDWARETQKRAGGDDPLASTAFVSLWEKGQQGDANAALIAAASISLLEEEAVEALKKARAEAKDTALQQRLDHALFQSAVARRKREEIVAYGKALLAAYPQSSMALQTTVGALGNLKRYAEAEALLAERFQRNPNDEEALRGAMYLGLIKASYGEMLAKGQKLIEIGEANVNDYNSLAWGVFAEKGAVDEAMQFALKGSSTQKLSFGLLHTLAAIHAGSGKITEARGYLVQAMETAKLDQPNSECNFVLGQIAEGLGMRDAALALYAKVKSPDADDDSAYGSPALAAKRIAALKGTSVEKK
jgi:tetratricopeptide (TPR) repeat protein